MPRPLRKDVLFDGCFSHVISRSIRKMKIFKDDKDFQAIMGKGKSTDPFSQMRAAMMCKFSGNEHAYNTCNILQYNMIH